MSRQRPQREAMKFLRLAGLVLLTTMMAIGMTFAGGDEVAAYVKRVDATRAERVKRLVRPDGWLTLVGLHFLRVGPNTIGSAQDNTILFPKGPAHLGTVTLTEDGRASITLNPAAEARIDGRELLSATLSDGSFGPVTVVTSGSLSFFVIERSGKKALRVKDSEAPRRTGFVGLDYYPVDPTWRIEAQWIPFDRPREVPIRNVLGQESPALVPGKAVFTKDGHTCELLPIIEGADEPLFFVIADLTSGTETYAAARFLYADPPQNGKIILDFNLAENPPCAFTPYATCPLPPKENRLPIAVTAGEKNYRGGHE
jgi:uncharacterized protein (DUF1684 family)